MCKCPLIACPLKVLLQILQLCCGSGLSAVAQGGSRVETRIFTCYVRFPRLHSSMSLNCTMSSPPVNCSLLPSDHSLQATVTIMNISSLPPPILSRFLPPPSTLLTVCRIGEAYRLATTIKVQQVSGGSSHHWNKLHKRVTNCFRRKERKIERL